MPTSTVSGGGGAGTGAGATGGVGEEIVEKHLRVLRVRDRAGGGGGGDAVGRVAETGWDRGHRLFKLVVAKGCE